MLMSNSVLRAQPLRTFDHQPAADGRPLAIGANFHDDPICRSSQRKSHTLMLKPRPQAGYAPHTTYTFNGGATGTTTSATYGSRPLSTPVEGPALTRTQLAAERAAALDASLEREARYSVLRFLAYLREAVPESPDERVRIRKVAIDFFPLDSSIAIREAKQPNSGMDEGLILSRRQVPHPSGTGVLGLDAIRVGAPVSIFGHTYHVVGMDSRTRQYLEEELGWDDVPPGSVPWPAEDTYNQTMSERKLHNVKRQVTTEEMDEKRVLEQLMTGIYTKHPNDAILSTQQFMRNRVNEHLSFLAVWDDRASLSGDLRFCVIRVYLENDAVEIVEQRRENCGRIGSATLLQRHRVPRSGVDVARSHTQQHTFGVILRKGYLTPADFAIGATLRIYERDYFVYDADAYTRRYMATTVGCPLDPPVDLSVTHGVSAEVVATASAPVSASATMVAETTGSSGTALGMGSTTTAGNGVMMFGARLANFLTPGDKAREFVITFDCATGELQILEKQIRNSGFIGGRFLVKGRHPRVLPDGRTVPFVPADFVVGATVTIYERSFILTGMDKATERIVAGVAEPVAEERVRQLVLLFNQLVLSRYPRAHDAFCALAPTGVLTIHDIATFMRARSCPVTEEEATYVMQNASSGGRSVLHFDDFVRLLDTSAKSMDEASLSSRSVRNVTMVQDSVYERDAKLADQRYRRRVLHQMLLEKLCLRRGSTQEQFRLLAGHSANSKMSKTAFRTSLNEVMHFNVSAEDEDTLVALLFDGREDADGEITYQQFQEFTELQAHLQ